MDVDDDRTESRHAVSSALELLIHPLVLLNITDHATRSSYVRKTQSSAPPDTDKIVGAVLGIHKGRELEICSSFELKFFRDASGKLELDTDFLRRKSQSMKKVMGDMDVVGWYTTGPNIHSGDHVIHRTMCELFDTAILMLVDMSAVATSQELPLSVFEGDIRILDGASSVVFAPASFRIETQEAERIALDHVAHVQAGSAGGSGDSQLVSQLSSLHGSISMLSQRIETMNRLLEAVHGGSIEPDHQLIRQISAVCHNLPTVTSAAFRDELTSEFNDSLMMGYLASVTTGCAVTSEIIERLHSANDSSGRKTARTPI